MDNLTQMKEWINEHVPMVNNLYQNKYVGMVYDRFASLHPKKQKQVILGVVAGLLTIILGYLGMSYLDLWGVSKGIDQAQEMMTLLKQYQKDQRVESANIMALERSSKLGSPDQFRKIILGYGQGAEISPRMIKIEERQDGAKAEDAKTSDVTVKQATITLERVNLTQLKKFLNIIEFAEPNMGVSSINIRNDDKIRGYMNVVFGIVVYLFKMEQG